MHFAKAKGILSANNGMNVYRGCTHGCIYCDSRSLCYHIEHRFEDVEAKINAPELLEAALLKKRKKCMIGTGSMCDPYLPLEEKLNLTRQCNEIIEKHGFGLTVLTKSARVLRDLDIFKRINEKTKCVVQMTLTTYDEALCRVVEPYVSTTRERFEALCTLRDNGIPTVVWLSPLLPFINDTEENLRGVLGYCRDAGVKGIVCFGMGLTLREGDREFFYQNLDAHFPGLKQKYIETYGLDYSLPCDNEEYLFGIFNTFCKENNILYRVGDVFGFLREFEDKTAPVQQSFF